MRPPTKPRRREVCTILMCNLQRRRLRLVQNPDNSLPERFCPRGKRRRSGRNGAYLSSPPPPQTTSNGRFSTQTRRGAASSPLSRGPPLFRSRYDEANRCRGSSRPDQHHQKSAPGTGTGAAGDLGRWHGTRRAMSIPEGQPVSPAHLRQTAGPTARTRFCTSYGSSPARLPRRTSRRRGANRLQRNKP